MATSLSAVHAQFKRSKSSAAIKLSEYPHDLDEPSVHRLAQAVYGLDMTGGQTWPGSKAFTRHICERFKTINPKWIEALGMMTPESAVNTRSCVDFLCEVSLLIKNSTTDTTIDDLLPLLTINQGRDLPHTSSEEWKTLRRVLFCVLAWVTLLVDVRPSPPDGHFEVIFPGSDTDSCIRQPLDSARRPICAMFRTLCRTRLFYKRSHSANEAGQISDLIHASSVSYSMLYRFGKITIDWTDLISCHLWFDSATRTLYLFRLPTYCALGCMQEGQDCLFDHIMRNYFDESERAPQNIWLQFRQEILLSYRILFGHDKESRKMFRKIQKHAEKNKVNLSDPLLEVLCLERSSSSKIGSLPGSMWPKSCRSLENKLQKEDEYSISSDLPLLGPRLLELQEFNLRQRPRSFRGFWKDKRDKPKWYTIWVVLIVGGVAILLALVQIGLSIAQLSVSIKPDT